jgi:glycosyltransferase involved in cell wall biosynthesis
MSDCSLLMLTWNNLPQLKYYFLWYRGYFDDFLVIDNDSTDGTREFLKQYGATFLEHRLENFAESRNYLQDHAKHDWVFHLDADEFPEHSFMTVMHRWIKPEPNPRIATAVAFKMPRVNYMGRDYPDYQIRLLNRRYCVWGDKEPPHVYFKRDMKLVDEWRDSPTGRFSYSQTLDMALFHDIAFDEAAWLKKQERWKALSENSS